MNVFRVMSHESCLFLDIMIFRGYDRVEDSTRGSFCAECAMFPIYRGLPTLRRLRKLLLHRRSKKKSQDTL